MIAQLHQRVTRASQQGIAIPNKQLSPLGIGIRTSKEIQIRLSRDNSILISPLMDELDEPNRLRIIQRAASHGFIHHGSAHPTPERRDIDDVAEENPVARILPLIGGFHKGFRRLCKFIHRPMERG